ncbi:MAG: hypothetical protein IPJ52_14005 [Rhodocyclaceae bacterium]|nr:hypothetical protein [Rhodocyclaceae bacterium]
MLSMPSLMGTAALMTQSDEAKAAIEWAEHFQKNYRLMTDAERLGGARPARASLFRRNTASRSRSTPPARSPAC